MQKLIKSLALIAGLTYAGSAVAQDTLGDDKANKYYIGLQGGVMLLQDSELSDPALSGSGLSKVEAEFSTGFNVGAIVGYKFTNGIRLEGEYNYRRAELDDITGCVSGVGCASLSSAGAGVDGDVSAHAFMANGFWEPRFGNFLPSIGGGLGVAIVRADLTLSVPGLGSASADESDTVFAWQAGAGIGYAFTDNVIGSVDYRYWATSDPKFDTTEAEVGSHNINAGIRVQF